MITGALCLGAAAGGIALYRVLRPSVVPPASVAITRFRAAGHTEREDGLAMSLAENLKSALIASGKVDVRDIQPAPPAEAAAMARRIAVEAFLTGSVQTSGAGVESTVSLVRVSDGKTLWTASFLGTVSNWFAVEDRAASGLLSGIWNELPVVRHHTADPEADLLFWRGRLAMAVGTREALRKAGELFQQAAEKDKADAPAWAGLADASLLLSARDQAARLEMLPRVRTVARRAIELDPTISEPFTALGLVAQNYDWNWDEAEHDLKRATDLDPYDALARLWYGEYLVLTGQTEKGLAELQKAEHLEPLSVLIATEYSRCLYLARRYDDAIMKAREALGSSPQALEPHRWLAAALLQKGMALESAAETALLGAPATPLSLAMGAAGAGNKDKAFGFLDQAFTEHEVGLANLKTDPAFLPLRTDPRFTALLARMHFRQP